MSQIWATIPLLGLLACPLMMVFCIWGVRRMTCAAPPTAQPAASDEERIAQLERQLSRVQTELRTLHVSDSARAETTHGPATALDVRIAR